MSRTSERSPTTDTDSGPGRGERATPNDDLQKVEEGYFGYGDFADVYKGSLNGKPVAIKQFRGVSLNQTGIRDNLRTDLLNSLNGKWKTLDHPNVCRVFTVSSEFGFLPALVLDYFPRGSLIKHIEKHDPPFDQRIKWVFEICEGLDHLHSHGVYHGNLRGANVFLGDRNQAVIADYGIAHHFNSSDFTSAKSTGTVRWTGPEVISLPPHPSPMPDKLDIFALGMTMLEVFSGKPPYHDKSDTGAILAISKSEPPTLPDNISRNDGLNDIFKACTRKEPTERPTARQVADTLKPFLPSRGIMRRFLRYFGGWIGFS